MPFLPAIEPPAERGDAPALYFMVHRKGLVVCKGDAAMRMLNEAEARSLVPDAASTHYLGQLDGTHCFTLPAPEEVAAPFEIWSLRSLYGSIPEAVFGVAGRAVQIVDWAATHQFCGRCATPTERARGERSMRCPSCALTAYPRIAPAIIVLVRKGDLALLAHGSRFPAPFYSTLAGFVEPGESLEETLVREVKEEVGVDVGDIRYFGSQSWPFPHSLMLGFFATWKAGEIVCDPTEIVDAKWFEAGALPVIPPPLSISRQLIDAWLNDVRGA